MSTSIKKRLNESMLSVLHTRRSHTSIVVNFLVSRILPYIYSQSGEFPSFLSSGFVGPIIYTAVDITLRVITTGSFREALFSPQALLNASIITLFFVPGGQYIVPAVMAFSWIFTWIRDSEMKAKYELFDEVLHKEYYERLLSQAEMSVKGFTRMWDQRYTRKSKRSS